MNAPATISVTILTKNSARHLQAALESARDFNEVVILDSGSTDDTLAIARRFSNAKIHTTQFNGFGPLHNQASALARNDWILSLDSDEVLTPELIREIKALSPNPDTVYTIARQNYYNGRWIRWCGWHPDRQKRVYHRKRTRFTDAQVHEAIVTDQMQVTALQHPLQHFPYDSAADFLTKMQHYSTLFAQQNQGRMSSSLGKAIGHGTGTFLKSYLVKLGFLGGREGFVISLYNAQTAYYKYLKLLEANERAD